MAYIKSIFSGIVIGVAASYLLSVFDQEADCADIRQQSAAVQTAIAPTSTQTAQHAKQSEPLPEQPQAKNPESQQAATYLTSDAAAEETNNAQQSQLSADLTEFVANNPMYFTGVKSALKYDEYYVEGVRELSRTGEKNEWSTSYENGLYNETKLFSDFLINQELQCNIKVCVLTGETNNKNTLNEIQEKLETKDMTGWGIDIKQNENGGYTFYLVKNNNNDLWPAAE
ncbi:hypothetical protein [Rheinheimera sp.]|uniref:hypothetical protein n=1 Tax=Rheinheimera sp. TaxID=1869214 RepID=UPI002FDD6DA1